jgi:hypothetical protein
MLAKGGTCLRNASFRTQTNVEDVTALALGFVVSPPPMETDKYFPNLGSTVAACAGALGWHEIRPPYLSPAFQCATIRLVALAPLRIFRLARTVPMRLLVLVIVSSLGTGSSLAQTNIGGSSASAAGAGSPDGNPTSLSDRLPSAAASPAEEPQRPSPSPAQNLHDSAVAACKEMWDAGTHMTKQQWSNTCKRIQTRLDNLGVEATMPKDKAQIR